MTAQISRETECEVTSIQVWQLLLEGGAERTFTEVGGNPLSRSAVLGPFHNTNYMVRNGHLVSPRSLTIECMLAEISLLLDSTR